MVQGCKSSRDFRIGPGSGLSLSKYFGLISGLHKKLFYSIRSTGNDFFLSWRRFVVLTAVTSVSEVIMIFFSANSVCKHSSVIFFSARISLTLSLRRRQRWGNSHAMALPQEINHSRDSWLVLRSLQAGLSCL